MLTKEQLARWNGLLSEMYSDHSFMAERKLREDRRRIAIPEMQDVLSKYLSGAIDNTSFKAVFQRKASKEWGVLGLNGFSGAMFLNMLTNNLPDQQQLNVQLRRVLMLPRDVEDGKQKMRDFHAYVMSFITSGDVRKQDVQPSHIPFFVSVWWHIQASEVWPIFYISARKTLLQESFYASEPDRIDEYFLFRSGLLSLAEALNIGIWPVKNLLLWCQTIPHGHTLDATPIVQPPAEDEERIHTHIQWLLARIGQKFGYRVWVAKNDRNQTWRGESIQAYTIEELPKFNGITAKTQRTIELIDVLWLKSNKIVAAFEIESTTAIYSGILRMADLAVMLDNFNFPLYVAVPDNRRFKVEEELSRPSLQKLGLHESCRFFTFEQLIEESEPMMRYGQDVKAIERISVKVDAIDEDM